MYDENGVPRPVTRADFAVVFAGFIHNLASSFHALTDDLLQIAIYHATRESKLSQAWEQFTQDLETMEE